MTLHLIDDKSAPKSQRFRWQLKAKNGKIVGASSEGFSTARGCGQNVAAVMDSLAENFGFACSAVHFAGRDQVKVRR